MKKYLSFMTFVMLAVFSFAFVSCGGDDDDDDFEPSTKGSQLMINGKQYDISFIQPGVVWSEIPIGSVILFFTGKKGMLSDDGELYTFGFGAWDQENAYDEPKVGMDITKFGRDVEGAGLFDWGKISLTDDNDIDCDYVSGSLIITGIDKKEESITFKFINLKMSNGKVSYTFNGTLKLPF